MDERKEITSGTTMLYVSDMTSAGVRAITYMLLLNAMGSPAFGVFSLAIATSLLIQLGTIGGTGWTISVFFARNREERHKSVGVVSLAITSITILLFSTLFFPTQIDAIIPGGFLVFLWASLLFPIIALRALLTSILNGSKEYTWQASSTIVSSFLLASIIGWMIYQSTITIGFALGTFAFSEIIGLSIQTFKARQITELCRPDKHSAAETFRFSKVSQSSTLLVTVGREGLLLLLGYLLGEVEVAVFNMAVVLSSPLLYLGNAFAVVLVAFVAGRKTLGKYVTADGLQHLLIIVSLSTIMVWWLSPYVLPMIFIEYEAIQPLLEIAWLAGGIGSVSQALRSVTYASERFTDDLYAVLISTVIAIGAFLLLIGQLGVLSIAVAYLVRYVIWSIVLWIRSAQQGEAGSFIPPLKSIFVLICALTAFVFTAQTFGNLLAGPMALIAMLLAGLVVGIVKDELQFWVSLLKSFISRGENQESQKEYD